jgi:uncharacterized membrane protein YfcA
MEASRTRGSAGVNPRRPVGRCGRFAAALESCLFAAECPRHSFFVSLSQGTCLVTFETAGIEVAPWIPPLVAFAISFFTSMGGVSGAFLLLPFQMSILGYTAPSVSATNHLFNIVGIPGGVFRYWKERRMVWPLTLVIVTATLPGVVIGAFLRVSYLPDPSRFKLFAACVLLYIGFKMVRDLLRKGERGEREPKAGPAESPHGGGGHGAPRAEGRGSLAPVKVTHFTVRRFAYSFGGERFEVSVWALFALSFIVGIVGGIYGIGGGSIVAPFLVTIFGLPVHTVSGAALMGTFVTSAAGVVSYQLLAPLHPGMSVAPDWLLGVLLGAGGLVGMYLGAYCQKYVPPRAIKWMLAGIILFTAIKYATAVFGL